MMTLAQGRNGGEPRRGSVVLSPAGRPHIRLWRVSMIVCIVIRLMVRIKKATVTLQVTIAPLF